MKKIVKKQGITTDDIEKAEKLLGLGSHQILSKGDDEEDYDDEDEDDEEEMKPKKKKKKAIKKMYGSEEEEKTSNKKKKIKKAFKKDKTQGGEEKTLHKAIVGDLSKAFNKKFAAVGTMLQGIREENQKLKKINKGLQTDLEKVLDQPLKRKSKLEVRERFLEKANQDGKILSLSKDKRRILNLLDRATFEKGEKNMFWGSAMSSYQIGGTLSKQVIEALQDEKGIIITK